MHLHPVVVIFVAKINCKPIVNLNDQDFFVRTIYKSTSPYAPESATSGINELGVGQYEMIFSIRAESQLTYGEKRNIYFYFN